MRTSRVMCLILGGGRGSRLYPLTKSRSKPAVPIAGKYRLIDIPISNCIHSDLKHIYVLTQFNSVSLHRHISNTYKFDAFGGGFVEVLAAQQTMESETWYDGTADAVRRNIRYFSDPSIDLVLILSGDQLYHMDFQDMIRTHRENKAAATIAALPVAEEAVHGFGVMKLDAHGRVTAFAEKPRTPEERDPFRIAPRWIEERGIPARGREFLASMGIYLFDRKLLVDLLRSGNAKDFGKEVFPQAIHQHHVQAHLFDGYWEDIGTIGAFHKANIDMARDNPPFEFVRGNQSIFTRPRFLPCSRLSSATIRESLISDGCIIGPGSVIENAVIGVRALIGANVVIRNSYVMGTDSYESPEERQAYLDAGEPYTGIGDNTVIENAIVDKHARIGRNVRIVNASGVTEAPESQYCVINDGIVVVPRFTMIPDGTVI